MVAENATAFAVYERSALICTQVLNTQAKANSTWHCVQPEGKRNTNIKRDTEKERERKLTNDNVVRYVWHVSCRIMCSIYVCFYGQSLRKSELEVSATAIPFCLGFPLGAAVLLSLTYSTPHNTLFTLHFSLSILHSDFPPEFVSCVMDFYRH